MKTGTKIGWLLIAVSIILSLWVIVSQNNRAATDADGYEIDDGTQMLVKIPDGASGDITLPADINGVTVLGISGDIFNDNISSITVPASSTAYTTLTPANFNSATSLSAIYISGSGSSYSASGGVLYNGSTLVYAPIEVGTVSIPESGVTTIGADAFLNSTLESLYIPANITSIGDQTVSWDRSFTVYVKDESELASGDYPGTEAYQWGTRNEYTVLPKTAGSTYSVTYHNNVASDELTTADTVSAGSEVTIRDYPFGNEHIPAGYTFAGWSTTAGAASADSTYAPGNTYKADANLDLYAIWTDGTTTTYNISYNSNGGSGTMATQAVTAGYPVTLTTNAFTRTGFTFTGWNTAADGTGTAYAQNATFAPDADMVLYAQWIPDGTTFTITYNANGGTGTVASQTVTAGQGTNTRSNGFTRPGYTFVAWNTAANGSGESIAAGAPFVPRSNTTLYAQWTTGNVYTVSFDGNGATGGTMSPQYVSAGSSLSLTANAFTRNGYNFSGWNTASNGTGTSYANGATIKPTGNMTLYAQWVTPQNSASGTTGSGSSTTTTTTTTSTTGGSSGGSGGHEKDATPKTADGDIDPRYMLALGILAVGIAAIIGSRKKQINYTGSAKDNNTSDME